MVEVRAGIARLLSSGRSQTSLLRYQLATLSFSKENSSPQSQPTMSTTFLESFNVIATNLLTHGNGGGLKSLTSKVKYFWASTINHIYCLYV